MSNRRAVWVTLGVVSTACFIGSAALLAAMEKLAGMVVMDFTSVLRSEGAITDERWNALIDDMAPHFHGVFQLGMVIPALFMLLAMVHFFVAWKCGRGPRATPPSSPHVQQ